MPICTPKIAIGVLFDGLCADFLSDASCLLTLVLIFFQFSGNKRQFTQMTSFDLISNFVLSSILGGYLFNANLSWIDFIYIVTIYFVISGVINYLAKIRCGAAEW